MDEDQVITIFCSVDDFYKTLEPKWHKRLVPGKAKVRNRTSALTVSEIMTVTICFHQAGYRNFKWYYLNYVRKLWLPYFPNLPSYNRFIELMRSAIFPLFCYLQSRLAQSTHVSIIDATPLPVCHVKRASNNKVFRGIAAKAKSSMGWFFGFKLHLVINHKGELVSWQLTKGNADDRKSVESMTQGIQGLLLGDKGYISSQLFHALFARGLKLITKVRKNMKNKLMSYWEKKLLRKRGVIESVNNELKNTAHIQHTRHRSPWNFCVNLISGLISYTFHQRKPSINLNGMHYLLPTS